MNRARCEKCKTVIESKHGHDFQQCKCGAIFVDGGNTYQRAGFDVPENFTRINDDGTEERLVPSKENFARQYKEVADHLSEHGVTEEDVLDDFNKEKK